MTREMENLQRALIAAQVALLEFNDESVVEDKALPALEKCVQEIGARFKVLKKAWS